VKYIVTCVDGMYL